jgi:hypothetical protein
MPNHTSSSIHNDLFPTATNNNIPAIACDSTCSKINATSSSHRHSTLESINSNEAVQMTSSWKMKVFVLISMLSLPGT